MGATAAGLPPDRAAQPHAAASTTPHSRPQLRGAATPLQTQRERRERTGHRHPQLHCHPATGAPARPPGPGLRAGTAAGSSQAPAEGSEKFPRIQPRAEPRSTPAGSLLPWTPPNFPGLDNLINANANKPGSLEQGQASQLRVSTSSAAAPPAAGIGRAERPREFSPCSGQRRCNCQAHDAGKERPPLAARLHTHLPARCSS